MQNKSGFKFGNALLVVVLILVVLGLWFLFKDKPTSVNDIKVENQILGKIEDVLQFSVLPGSSVGGVVNFTGEIKGGWFFEGNIQINILDKDKNLLKAGHGTATEEWATAEPVEFAGSIDLTGIPAGPAYFEIHNDNASGEPVNDKFVQIPIIIK